MDYASLFFFPSQYANDGVLVNRLMKHCLMKYCLNLESVNIYARLAHCEYFVCEHICHNQP